MLLFALPVTLHTDTIFTILPFGNQGNEDKKGSQRHIANALNLMNLKTSNFLISFLLSNPLKILALSLKKKKK